MSTLRHTIVGDDVWFVIDYFNLIYLLNLIYYFNLDFIPKRIVPLNFKKNRANFMNFDLVNLNLSSFE